MHDHYWRNDMGLMDDMKDKAEAHADEAKGDNLKDTAGDLKDSATGKAGAAAGEEKESLLDKAKDAVGGLKAKLDKDGDGDIDALDKVKDVAGGLVNKAKGLFGKDKG